eukprot:CAMPEP_0179145828 /NCGR_PEP_ID=MMETSP0796-20121207/70384_1 /TAXON_ID=73915 /ORGANISM="Pyrodinium bahamense, Strain pbaha01" /LENGTH=160 /DNA_ID=CAMNT_0020846257 /DNA_START=22 /DNA_END=499 /DNA_ORIENTATION=+
MRLPMSSLIAPENAATKIMTCRICMETEPASDLCSPCLCRGSMKYVHSQCLQRWRSASTNQHSRYRCEQCQYPYSLSRIGASDFMLKPQVMDLGVKLALAAATAAVYALFAMATDEHAVCAPTDSRAWDHALRPGGILAYRVRAVRPSCRQSLGERRVTR